jgi:N-acetyl-anhydromuramyl-L-alanine amidase AmpD
MPNALWLADVLRAAGLKVSEVDGWKTRGHATMGEVKGVLCHHTASKAKGNMPSLVTVRDGRPDLAGPLAHLGLGRDGTFYVIAAGLCYHAGRGAWQGVTAGNSSFIGIEAENDGISEPWPEIQLGAYAQGIAAILKHIGAPVLMCAGHREFAKPAGRKIDPDFDMDAFRLRVAGFMNGAAGRPLIPAKDAQARPTLRRGATGAEVSAAQRALGVKADGQFGPQMEAALRSFQRSHGLVPDGILGPSSRAALDAQSSKAA